MFESKKNNIYFKLWAWLSPIGNLVVIWEWKETLIEDFIDEELTKSFKWTIVKMKQGVPYQTEIVNVISKNGKNLIVQRAVEKCPMNWSSTELVQNPYQFDEGDVFYMNITAGDLIALWLELLNKVDKNDGSYTKKWNTFNWIDELVITNEDWDIDLWANKFIWDGSLLDWVISETEKIFLKNLIPGETLSNWIYWFSLWKTSSWEDVNKIYKRINWDILGIYKWATNWYTDTFKDYWNANIFKVNWSNIFGFRFQHKANSINKLKILAWKFWNPTAINMNIYPLIDIAWTMYINNTNLLQSVNISNQLLNIPDITDVWENAWYSISLFKEFLTKSFTLSNNLNFKIKYTLYWNQYLVKFRIRKNWVDIYSYDTASGGSTITLTTWMLSWVTWDVFTFWVQWTWSSATYAQLQVVDLLMEERTEIDFTDLNLTPNINYWILFECNEWATNWLFLFWNNTSTDNNLYSSTWWITNSITNSAWWISCDIISGQAIELINLITAGLYENIWLNLTKNTKYYSDNIWSLSTSKTWNLFLWTAITENDIFIEEWFTTLNTLTEPTWEWENTPNQTYVLRKSYKVQLAWKYLVWFYLRTWSSSVLSYWRIYKNWVPYWTERAMNSTTTAYYTEYLDFEVWDTIEFWSKSNTSSYSSYAWWYYIDAKIIENSFIPITIL